MSNLYRGIQSKIGLLFFGVIALFVVPANAAEAVNAQILQVTGTASSTTSGGLVRPVVPGSILVAGGRLKTESTASVAILWTNGAVSVLSGGTEVELVTLTLDRAQGQRVITLKLLHGTLTTKLVPEASRLFTFEIETPRGLVQAQSGAWRTRADLNRTVTIAVLRDETTFIFPSGRRLDIAADHIVSIPTHGRPILLTPDQIADISSALDPTSLGLTASLAPSADLGHNYLRIPVEEFPITAGNFQRAPVAMNSTSALPLTPPVVPPTSP